MVWSSGNAISNVQKAGSLDQMVVGLVETRRENSRGMKAARAL